MDFSQHPVLFSKFSTAIRSFKRADADRFVRNLTLATSGPIEVVYSPFDHIPARADLVIIGITPGRTQALNALASAADALRDGASYSEAQRVAKLSASFSGAMRANLISMLDHIGINARLGLTSCSTIFDPASERVHFTSALRYPVFVGGQNYNGAPDMLTRPLLTSMIDILLSDEAARLPNAIWLPLGPQAHKALGRLVQNGALRQSQVLNGLPHPSGANAERIAYFVGRKPKAALSSKTDPVVLDEALRRLRGKSCLHCNIACRLRARSILTRCT